MKIEGRGREVERAYRKELVEALKEWRKGKEEREKKVKKVETLGGQLRVHFEATKMTNKGFVVGVLVPKWFLVGGANEVLDVSGGVLPKKVVGGVVEMVERIMKMEGYEAFFKALKFEGVVGVVGGKAGEEGMGRFIRRMELVVERREMNLDPFLFVWRRWLLKEEGQR